MCRQTNYWTFGRIYRHTDRLHCISIKNIVTKFIFATTISGYPSNMTDIRHGYSVIRPKNILTFPRAPESFPDASQKWLKLQGTLTKLNIHISGHFLNLLHKNLELYERLNDGRNCSLSVVCPSVIKWLSLHLQLKLF